MFWIVSVLSIALSHYTWLFPEVHPINWHSNVPAILYFIHMVVISIQCIHQVLHDACYIKYYFESVDPLDTFWASLIPILWKLQFDILTLINKLHISLVNVHDDIAGYFCLQLSFLAAINCGEAPVAPANGQRSGSGTTFGSIVTYTCNHGYSPSAQGHNRIVITCMANGRWTGSAPECYSKLSCNYIPMMWFCFPRDAFLKRNQYLWFKIVISVLQCLLMHGIVCKLNLFWQIVLSNIYIIYILLVCCYENH